MSNDNAEQKLSTSTTTSSSESLTKRELIAAMAMQGLLSGGENACEPLSNSKRACNYADALIKQLDATK